MTIASSHRRLTPWTQLRNTSAHYATSAVLVVSALTVIFTVVAYRILDSDARDAASNAGQSRANAARAQPIPEREQLVQSNPPTDAVSSVVTSDGQTLSGPRITPIFPISDYEPFRRTPYRVELDNGIVTEAYGGYITLAGDRLLFIGVLLDPYRAKNAPVLWAMIICGISAAGILIGCGIRAQRRVERQLAEVVEVLERISRGDFSRTLTGNESGDEWNRLCAHVNMAGVRLSSMIGQLGTLADLVSHELGSTVGLVQRRIERISKAGDLGQAHEAAREALAETLRVRGAVQALLELNNIRRGGTQRFARVDLAIVARDVIKMYAATAEDAQIDVQPALEKGEILGERDLIVQLLANLIDNAIKYTPANGTIRVAIATESDTVVLTVDDSGPGIPMHLRDSVFLPARRLTRDRGKHGFGYGLSVVHAIAKRHGGDVALPDVSQGLRVRVTFPRFSSATQRGPRNSPSISR